MAANDFGRLKLWLAGGTAFAVVYGWAWFATNAPAEAFPAAPETTPVTTAVPSPAADATGTGAPATAEATATAVKPTPTPVPTRVKKSRGS